MEWGTEDIWVLLFFLIKRPSLPTPNSMCLADGRIAVYKTAGWGGWGAIDWRLILEMTSSRHSRLVVCTLPIFSLSGLIYYGYSVRYLGHGYTTSSYYVPYRKCPHKNDNTLLCFDSISLPQNPVKFLVCLVFYLSQSTWLLFYLP